MYYTFRGVPKLDTPWCPASDKSLIRCCNNINHPTNDTLKPCNQTGKPVLKASEVKDTRLLQGYIMYRTPDGTIARGRVALDTQSNMSFSIACVSLAREKRPWETDVVYGVGGKPVSVGETLSFTVMRNGQAVTLDTHEGPPGLLANGVCALFSCDC